MHLYLYVLYRKFTEGTGKQRYQQQYKHKIVENSVKLWRYEFVFQVNSTQIRALLVDWDFEEIIREQGGEVMKKCTLSSVLMFVLCGRFPRPGSAPD